MAGAFFLQAAGIMRFSLCPPCLCGGLFTPEGYLISRFFFTTEAQRAQRAMMDLPENPYNASFRFETVLIEIGGKRLQQNPGKATGLRIISPD
jgi:hypothetical protein